MLWLYFRRFLPIAFHFFFAMAFAFAIRFHAMPLLLILFADALRFRCHCFHFWCFRFWFRWYYFFAGWLMLSFADVFYFDIRHDAFATLMLLLLIFAIMLPLRCWFSFHSAADISLHFRLPLSCLCHAARDFLMIFDFVIFIFWWFIFFVYRHLSIICFFFAYLPLFAFSSRHAACFALFYYDDIYAAASHAYWCCCHALMRCLYTCYATVPFFDAILRLPRRCLPWAADAVFIYLFFAATFSRTLYYISFDISCRWCFSLRWCFLHYAMRCHALIVAAFACWCALMLLLLRYDFFAMSLISSQLSWFLIPAAAAAAVFLCRFHTLIFASLYAFFAFRWYYAMLPLRWLFRFHWYFLCLFSPFSMLLWYAFSLFIAFDAFHWCRPLLDLLPIISIRCWLMLTPLMLLIFAYFRWFSPLIDFDVFALMLRFALSTPPLW